MSPKPQADPDPPADPTQGLAPGVDPGKTVDTGSTFGRYQHLQHVGSGGMATVFKAHDPTLGRTVALKLIRGDDPALAQRLLLEAKAQAKIEHEHVCRVYEAGLEGQRHYIAMQYVDGRTLRDLDPGLSLEQKLQIMRDVALGVHAAHRVGFVHRDLKPSNIMVERTEDGRWFPYVMDFGLAREFDAPGLTVTGLVLGTPWYMSPEQARGETHLDRRSDVYSLGATFYELLGGRPPFGTESNVTAVMKLLTEEPEPLARVNGLVPRDVETIVMKCLEKDPARRYDSARALAEDIGRFLDGEPLAARPPSLGYRLYVRARKNRALVAVSAVALAVVATVGIAALRARASARRQVQLAAEFSGTVRDVEWLMRVAHLAPLHDVGVEKARVRADLARIESRMKAVGSLAQGPGEYALGRGQLLLGDFDAARRHLEAAWTGGYRAPEVAYALGLTLGTLYQRELALADSMGNKDLRAAKRRQIQAALRDPAIGYLRQAVGTDAAAPEYVEGLLALYERRYDEALARAAAVRAQSPWLYETGLLEGDVHSVRSRERMEVGDTTGSRAAIESAQAAYAAAAAFARSDPAAYEGLCQMGLQRMEVTLHTTGDLASVYKGAQAACATALEADAERAEVYAKLSNVHRFWAERELVGGQDPRATLALAAEQARRALVLDSRNRRANGNLGVILRLQSSYAQQHGEDGSAYLEQAFASLRKAVELSGGDAGSVNDLGNAYVTRAYAIRDRGGDPRPDLDQAVAHYDRALALIPDFGYAHANRGSVLMDRAGYETSHGIDPRATMERGIGSLRRAVALLPKVEAAHIMLAQALEQRARFLGRQGDDPGPDVAASRASIAAAAALNPKPDPDVKVLSGSLLLIEARRALDSGGSPVAPIDAARALFRAAAAADPRYADAPRSLGDAELLDARASLRDGRDPSAALARAAAAFETAARINPKDADALVAQAEVRLQAALWKWTRHAPPEGDVAAGTALADRALALNPGLAPAFAVKGALLVRAAEASIDPARRRALAAQAQEALERGLAANSSLAREYGSERERARSLAQ